MRFQPVKLQGVFVIDLDLHEDERGLFARTWCANEFRQHGLNSNLVQCNTSFNFKQGTLRGMHFQREPSQECKLVRCTRGAIFDVVIDLRGDRPTYCDWFGIELSDCNRRMLYVPEGMAHGFITLRDESEVFYQMSEFYDPANSTGVRWNDPRFQIQWPMPVTCISERDAALPDYTR